VWDGWSYPWASCLYSRGLVPNAALRMLRLYAEEFVAPNTFHTNSTFRLKSGLDNNTWRLMSVEGGFMYLSGVQEMLLQSYGGRIVIFPGIPDDWRGRDIAFDSLQAEGGFLIDARVASGQFACARIRSPRGGRCVVRDNFPKGWRLLNEQGNPVPKRVRDGWIEWRTREDAVYFIVAAQLGLKQAKAILNHWPQQDRPAANIFGVK
jgi:alpha-L-fucosidase 2